MTPRPAAGAARPAPLRPFGRRLLPALGLGLLAGVLLGASDCPDGTAPAGTVGDFFAELVDSGPNQQSQRSQIDPDPDKDPELAIAFLRMLRPIVFSAQVLDEHEADDPAVNACVFLQGPDDLTRISGETDTLGNYGQSVLPTSYDVLVAPECLLGSRPARLIENVALEQDIPSGSPLDWGLPPREVVTGSVRIGGVDPVVGAVVTVSASDRPDVPLGISVETDSQGDFFFEVEPGIYDVVVSGPADGSVPIAPVRFLQRPLPLTPVGVRLNFNVPDVPVRTVRGVRRPVAGSGEQGRIRFRGFVSPLDDDGPFQGSFFQAEIETNADGSWELDLPAGAYTATSYPAYRADGSLFGVGRVSFEVSDGGGGEAIEGIELVMPDSRLGVVEVREPGAQAVRSAVVVMRMRTEPHFMWRVRTDASGDNVGNWTGLLLPGLHEVEVVPPRDPESNAKTFAHGHGQLDLTGGPNSTRVTLRRSERFEGFVTNSGSELVGDIRVLIRDPVTGELWDEAVTEDDGQFEGFFEGIIPR